MRYPNIYVDLGREGNGFYILNACMKAAKNAGLHRDEIKHFIDEAVSGDFNHLVYTCSKWFNLSQTSLMFMEA